ncbi:DUF2339 domain-containing protein [Bowmanella yangjiangensis]|uniref:DUF2339 domain-containing protein n=1 Tax=Bowmanella yangjiangensis TaxID=2811230 RepID=A0ABS3CYQ1_9ALTE|nr:DUF2339 domain-containing protein [Bowmanella yangjiangensis]MBN7821455.1 DUF2339 domain-containing protein [Bowmanella yangjiangensis]
MDALIGLICISGLIAGVVAFFKVLGLRRDLDALRKQVEILQQGKSLPLPARPPAKPASVAPKPDAQYAAASPGNSQLMPGDDHLPAKPAVTISSESAHQNRITTSLADTLKGWQKRFEQNGMVWIGALALALGGIFLAKYSLEMGLLSPVARIILGAGFGVALIAASVWLHRRAVPFEGWANYTPAALASGGFITCFTMVLLSYHNYAMLGQLPAFVLLAVIALAASYLSLLLGPLLAAIGIVGAYTVPLWVSSDSGNLLALLSYVSFVSLSVLLLAKRVQQNWLWNALFVGHFGWYIAALWLGQPADSLTFAGFILLTFYALVIVPECGWLLNQRDSTAKPFKRLWQPNRVNLALAALLIPALLHCLSLAYQPGSLMLVLTLAIMLISLPLLSSRFDHAALLSVLCLLVGVWVVPPPGLVTDISQLLQDGYLLVLAGSLVIFAYGFWYGRAQPTRLVFHLLTAFAPFVLIGVGYAMAPQGDTGMLYPLWATVLLLMAMVLAMRAKGLTDNWQAFCYLAGSNANLSLSLTMLLDGSTLTLALLIQVLAVSYLAKQRALALPHWIIKVLVSLVLLRLSLAPWTPGYEDLTLLGVHWSLVIYPVAIGLFYATARLWQDSELQAWLQGAILHLVALLVTTETSYWLVGHYPWPGQLIFEETVLLAMNWWLLGSLYLYRMQFAGVLAGLYRTAGGLLWLGGGLLQLQLLFGDNPFIDYQAIGEWPLLNWLIPLWGIPALLVWHLSRQHLQGKAAEVAGWGSGLLAMLFINGQIRQYWNGSDIQIWQATSDAEHYSYSLIWLILASSLVALAYRLSRPTWQRVGFGLMLLVILKVFILDMANLQGLLRALSFIGLGLCLVLLGWLFQRLRQAAEPATSN